MDGTEEEEEEEEGEGGEEEDVGEEGEGEEEIEVENSIRKLLGVWCRRRNQSSPVSISRLDCTFCRKRRMKKRQGGSGTKKE